MTSRRGSFNYDEAFIEKVRRCAEVGMTRGEVVELFDMRRATLDAMVTRHGMRFDNPVADDLHWDEVSDEEDDRIYRGRRYGVATPRAMAAIREIVRENRRNSRR